MEVIVFVNQMIARWQPARAFVLDIAETADVEINNFNSAGFYKANVGKLIDAVEK